MFYTVSVTNQGQISIPAKLRRQLGLEKPKKVLVFSQDGRLVAEPVKDILELKGSLKTKIKASPRQIREAFGKYLAQEAVKSAK